MIFTIRIFHILVDGTIKIEVQHTHIFKTSII